MNKTFGISIIVPVYNVEKYLDKCLESIVAQTDLRYELIIVNDGSTDNSAQKCKEWKKRKKDIIYVEQSNSGLGAARNRGVQEAHFDYITFVDSDDWIEETFVEDMLRTAGQEDSDLVYCNALYVTDNEEIIRTWFFRTNLQHVQADTFMRMAYGYPNMWGAIYKRKLWLEMKMNVPSVIYEDTASYIRVLDIFKNISSIDRARYVYRMGRQGSLMDQGKKKPQILINALNILVQTAKEYEIFEEYEKAIEAFCIRQLENEWEKIINKRSELSFEEGKKIISDFLDKYFRNWRLTYDRNYIAIGSYNTCAVFNRLKLFRELKKDKYQFASLIDLFARDLQKDRFHIKNCKNKYRESMIQKLFNRNFWEEVGSDSVLVVDLLSESTDLIHIEDVYHTKSEAFMEVVDLYGTLEIIPWWDERRFEIWKRACDQFAEKVKMLGCKIFLLDLYLSLEFGDEKDRRNFVTYDEIQSRNKILKKYYDYFIERVENVYLISLDSFYDFTDEMFSYGCIPEHKNEFAYYLLATDIVRRIGL